MPESTSEPVKTEDEIAGEQPAPVQLPPKPRVNRKKAIDLPAAERRNWLIHQHFVRKDYEDCKKLIKEQLIETAGECEYALYVQAMISRSEGRIAESTELLQACAKINPKSSEILKQIARNLFLVGKYKNAIECYKKAAQVSQTEDWEVAHQLGVCFLQLKQYSLAEDNFNEALNLNKHDITFSNLARLYLETNRMDKAVEVLKKGVEFAPENLELLTTLGLVYLRMKNFHASFELLGQALTFDPENYKAIVAAGSLMQVHGDYDVALTKYRVAAPKSESAVLWNNIAMCFFGKKKNVAAISCLKRAVYLAPFDWRILYNLCLLHLVMQQYASAFQFGSTALRLKPKNPDIYMLLAVALNHLGEVENARKSYEEAYRLDPDNAYVTLNYATFLYHNNETKKAQRMMKQLEETLKIVDSDPNKDKEIIDTAKKLGAALHLGDMFLRPAEEKKKQSSKEGKKKSSRKSTDPAAEAQPSESAPAAEAQPSESAPAAAVPSSPGGVSATSEKLSSPISPSKKSPLSSPGLPSLPGGNLLPLRAPNLLPAIGSKAPKLGQLPDVPTHEPKATSERKSQQLPAS